MDLSVNLSNFCGTDFETFWSRGANTTETSPNEKVATPEPVRTFEGHLGRLGEHLPEK
ncbi:MAG: hypothetical protein FD124_1160 [Alphaproteobacteria bacterium]|nr:MAG: hypothetical protein FD160_1840 [Caulobacteraceae bacterium]TPW07408.1 MAG: hypothetical protein FD124_1160 [Alphaproteobacteria bacterium]